MREYNDIHQAYIGTIKDVLDNPDYICSPRGLKIYETMDYSFRVYHPEAVSIVTKDEERNKIIAEYTKKEVALYNSCSNQVEDFAKASKFWEKIANPDGTINSAYGYLIFKNESQGHLVHEAKTTGIASKLRTPWQFALESLKADKDTRQATMMFALPEHRYLGNKDMTCTLSANWLIRDHQLHLSVIMRSNDLSKGLVYDMPWFVSLMDKMIEELRYVYPGLTKGCYTHLSHSMHIYERDIPQMLKMIGREDDVITPANPI